MTENRTQGVERTLSALTMLASGPKTISEAARELGVHRSTALRLLRALEDRKFVRRDSDLRYRAGSMLISLGQQALEDVELRSVAAPHLERLHDLTKETIHLGIIEDDAVVYIDKIDGQSAVRMWSRIGKRSPIHCTGLGKAIAAFLPPADLEPLAHRLHYEVFTPTTIPDAAAFLRDMEQIRERGWAVDDAEHEPIVHCIAAPVRQADGSIAGISIASPVRPLAELVPFVPDLLATAAAISREQGVSPIK
jgi:DNA-binding IclR family transcriptional regulator